MIDIILKRLRNKKILVAGYGREGKSTVNFLKKYIPEAKIGVADKNASALADLDNNVYNLYHGEDYLKAAAEYDIVIKTPGISLKDIDIEPSLLSSQTDLFLEAFNNQIIGVSGTKGKSTTSTLIYHLLKSAGKDVILAGNIGLPVFDCINDIKSNTVIVYELSAHQLQFITKSPHIGVLLNVFEEHLDHFGTFENYKNAKLNIMRLMCENDKAILCSELAQIADEMNVPYSIFNDFNIDEYEHIISECPLKGEHNKLNIKAALSACCSYGFSMEELLPHLKTFKPLEHRQEYVGVYHGLTFYNDSISTVPQATIAALTTIKNVNFLLLGGMDRGIDYQPLIDFLSNNVVPFVLITGDAGRNIKKRLESVDYKGEIIEYDDMESAMKILKRFYKNGDICLLSPAAASYDRYKNFEERGSIFKKLASEF